MRERERKKDSGKKKAQVPKRKQYFNSQMKGKRKTIYLYGRLTAFSRGVAGM